MWTLGPGLDEYPRWKPTYLRELRVNTFQRRKEARLGIEDGDIVCMVRWAFAVNIEHHSTVLHFCKYRVKLLVRDHPSVAIGCDTCWVGLDTNDSLSLCPFDDRWVDALVKIETHQVVDGSVLL